MLQCPDSSECKACFVSLCQGNSTFYYTNGTVFKGTVAKKTFNNLIEDLSPSFVEIYNEAYNAEQLDLNQICGVGYRKAIEFLMKDFAVMNNPDKEDEIKKMPLMQCIKKFIDSNNVKKVAERAVWLGNDETHYVRVWDAKDLQDLKKLIELTVHWIEVELLTKELEDDMPRKS
jgi:hydroxymethylpyrimidine pyrophosphatase-like HAD family hydrolase